MYAHVAALVSSGIRCWLLQLCWMHLLFCCCSLPPWHVQGESQGEHILILCNAIGSPVDSKVIELEPKFVALTGEHRTALVHEPHGGILKMTSVAQQL